MRHLVAFPVVAGLLASGGCAQLGLPSVSPTDISSATTTLIQDVDNLTSAACHFIPSAETIAGLATAGNSTATSALALATAIAGVICPVVQAAAPAAAAGTAPPPASLKSFKMRGGKRGVVLPSVNGVPITGYFVQ